MKKFVFNLHKVIKLFLSYYYQIRIFYQIPGEPESHLTEPELQ